MAIRNTGIRGKTCQHTRLLCTFSQEQRRGREEQREQQERSEIDSDHDHASREKNAAESEEYS